MARAIAHPLITEVEQSTAREEIRSIAAELCGFCSREEATLKSPAIPKITIAASQKDYLNIYGRQQQASQINLLIRTARKIIEGFACTK